MIDLSIKCPKCSSQHYLINYGVTTAMYGPTIVKDGKIISYNPNYTTYNCQCLECSKCFSVTANGSGAVESIEAMPVYNQYKIETSKFQFEKQDDSKWI